jgi:hypothetical protein
MDQSECFSPHNAQHPPSFSPHPPTRRRTLPRNRAPTTTHPPPLRSSSRRLWTAGRITAFPAHGVRLAALSAQARVREAPYSRLSPQAPLRTRSRRLWTAGRITALSAHGVRLPALSVQARDREAPYSRISPQAPLRTSAPKALDCWENHSSPCARSAPTSPLLTSPESRGSVLAPLPTSPLRTRSRRLWTAGRITALPAHGVRLPAPSLQARNREAPYSRLSPQAPLPTS